MPDIGLRNLGTIIPGARTEPPQPAPPGPAPQRQPQNSLTRPATAAAVQSALATTPIFAADASDDPAALSSSALGLDTPLELLAELASHARTQTPLAIGLFGPAGCGKSVALNKLVAAIERLSAAAAAAGPGPFLAHIAVVRIDAANLEGQPATALAEALYARLAAVAPGLALEASHAARDPDLAARAAFEQLDAARQKLEIERRALDEADARRAKLAETLLYETPGSQIDAFASRRRGPIKTAMASFGLAGDPLIAFKDLVAEAADSRGPSRTSFTLRAFLGLKGQRKRIVTAILLFAIGLGLRRRLRASIGLARLAARTTADSGSGGLVGEPRRLAARPARRGLRRRGSRAAVQYLARRAPFGAGPPRREPSQGRVERSPPRQRRPFRAPDAARRDPHRRSRAPEPSGGRGGTARRRPPGANPALAEPSPFAADARAQEARRFLAAAGALAARGANGSAHGAPAGSPRRIIVALDNLDALPPARARAILAQAHSLLGPGFVSLIAVDPSRLDGQFGDSPPVRLDKWIGAPLQVGEIVARQDSAMQICDILGGAQSPGAAKTPAALPDAKHCALDEPLSEAETQMLAAFAPLAGPSARAVKRFVNLYRLLRTQWRDRPEQRGALAFMLALDAGGNPAEIAAVQGALANSGGDAAFDPYQGGPRLASIIAALGATQGRPSIDALRQAAAAVKVFSFNS